MSQGPRRGWVRALFTGLGIVACTGLVGCMNSEKDKFPPKIGANTKQAPPGLPGTQRLPGQPGTGVGTGGQPAANTFQPASGFGSASGRPSGSMGASGVQSGVVPGMGPGAQTGGSGAGFGSGMGAPNLSAPAGSGAAGYQGAAYNSGPPMTNLGGDLGGPVPPTYPNAPANYEVTPPGGNRFGG